VDQRKLRKEGDYDNDEEMKRKWGGGHRRENPECKERRR